MAFIGFGQNDSGGQAEPSISSGVTWSIAPGFAVWASTNTYALIATASRGSAE